MTLHPKKKRIVVVITARPSYSRIKSALQILKTVDSVELQIICSASALLERYGRIVELIRADGFDVVEELYTYVEGNEPVNMAFTVSNAIAQIAGSFRNLKPDFVITIADRYETLGTAVAAAYLGIPLIHVQGGEITGNIDEKVRHAITKLSDVHLVATPLAGNRLIRMGEQPSSIHITGCPSIDLAREAINVSLTEVQNTINNTGVGHDINLKEKYVVVLQHPETDSFSESYSRTQLLLESISRLKCQVVVFWPNVDAGADATSKAIRVFREECQFTGFRFFKNLDGVFFLRLLYSANCLIGNSSVGIRESSYLGTPTVNIGARQNGRECSNNVVNCGWDKYEIIAAVNRQINHDRYASSCLYGDGYAGSRIANIIKSLINVTTTKRFYEA